MHSVASATPFSRSILATTKHFVAYSAPVHFPRVWYASWFEWVQYNGSIQQPMIRNAGEALGVRATINFPVAKDQLPTSSVQVNTIFELEQSLAGVKLPNAEEGFTGLTAPIWPENILPPIDTALAAKGATLYQAHCRAATCPLLLIPTFGLLRNGQRRTRRESVTSI